MLPHFLDPGLKTLAATAFGLFFKILVLGAVICYVSSLNNILEREVLKLRGGREGFIDPRLLDPPLRHRACIGSDLGSSIEAASQIPLHDPCLLLMKQKWPAEGPAYMLDPQKCDIL